MVSVLYYFVFSLRHFQLGYLAYLYRVLQGIGARHDNWHFHGHSHLGISCRGKGQSYRDKSGGSIFGLSVGPFLGGVLTQHLGWRSIFFFGGASGFGGNVLDFLEVKGEWAEAEGERFDIVGSMVFVISIVVMMYGFTMLPTTAGHYPRCAGCIGYAGICPVGSESGQPHS